VRYRKQVSEMEGAYLRGGKNWCFQRITIFFLSPSMFAICPKTFSNINGMQEIHPVIYLLFKFNHG
jgi:hypothetical protein